MRAFRSFLPAHSALAPSFKAAFAVSMLALSCAAPAREQHVVLISIDGLKPSVYTTPGPAKIPTLRRLIANGVAADGVVGVMPAVTYPAHTTLITGVPPASHGIYNNRILDIEDTSGGSWYWYARDIKVPTLLSAAKARGLTTAAINWPVTVDTDVDYLLPEFGGVYEHPIWLNLLRALTRPHNLLTTIEASGQPIRWPMTDADYAGIAAAVFRRYQPHVMLVHLFDVDDREHAHGTNSPEAAAAIEEADAQVARLLAAVDDAGLTARTTTVIVSDHGFLDASYELRPNFALREAGLFDEDDAGRIRRWDAYFQNAGGSGFVYLRTPDDTALRRRAKAVLDGLASDPANGVAAILDDAQLRALGADPRASFAVAMKDGFALGQGADVLRKAIYRGEHGYVPTNPAMHASLIMSGAGVPAGGSLGEVRMTEVAPTIAAWLGLTLDASADSPIPVSGEIRRTISSRLP